MSRCHTTITHNTTLPCRSQTGNLALRHSGTDWLLLELRPPSVRVSVPPYYWHYWSLKCWTFQLQKLIYSSSGINLIFNKILIYDCRTKNDISDISSSKQTNGFLSFQNFRSFFFTNAYIAYIPSFPSLPYRAILFSVLHQRKSNRTLLQVWLFNSIFISCLDSQY